ncbi:hypothetical protein J5N97_022978 [Dioscorea zingiberensis]|uniref:Uncharacterized protein n=1 Tax=Dioscorea zingiberensis TaxID=325984 RepID=A0A9D5CB51_9LILI|nr:hypothetical protein J5N97_022978 [Dioscorea zingiberensis]
MPSKKRKPNKQHARKSSCFPSCFSASSVLSDSDVDTDKPPTPKEYHKPSFFTRWRFRKSKKTVPVLVLEHDTTTPSKASNLHPDLEIKEIITSLPPYNKHKHNFFMPKFFKSKGDRNHRSKTNKLNHPTKSDKFHVSAKSREQANQNDPIESDSLTWTPDQVQTGCPSSPEPGLVHVTCFDKPKIRVTPNWRFKFNRMVRILVPVLTLTLIIFLGKAIAIAFLCFCLYSTPIFRTLKMIGDDGDEKIILDLNSAEYKKKVVLEGLLERPDKKSLKLHRK